VVIDGTTQHGYVGIPLIDLNGDNAGASAIGLTIQGGNSTVKGLIINSFAQAGIELTIEWTNTVTGNYLGTDSTGTGNGDGVLLSFASNNLIGGTDAQADRTETPLVGAASSATRAGLALVKLEVESPHDAQLPAVDQFMTELFPEQSRDMAT
jgi:hypothetical protein